MGEEGRVRKGDGDRLVGVEGGAGEGKGSLVIRRENDG